MARSCPACGRANDDDASFCQGCGAVLASVQAYAAGPAGAEAAPPGPPASPPPGSDPSAGGPPRRGKPAPRWLVTLIAVAAIALACVLVFVLFPRGGKDEGPAGPTPASAGDVGVSPLPRLGQYLAGAVGPKADQLAAIKSNGTVEPITRFSGGQIWQIAYSPEGKWLACIAGTYKRSELWLFSVTSGDARQVTAETPGIVAVDSVAWLSEGRLLVAGYAEAPEGAGQNAELLVFDVRARRFSPLAGAGGLALRGVSVSASHDGDRVVFVTYADHKTDKYGMASAKERLELLERATGEVTRLGEHEALFDVDARAFDEPLISPSGGAVIYRRAGSDVGTSYTVVAADGTELMPSRETQFPAGYAWDPTGTKVVFTGHSLKPADTENGVGPAVFWVFDTTAGSTTVLARYPDTMVQDLSWSPDGKSIAWAAYEQKKYRTGSVYLLPASGGDSSPLVEEALSPVWAPAATGSLQTSPSP